MSWLDGILQKLTTLEQEDAAIQLYDELALDLVENPEFWLII